MNCSHGPLAGHALIIVCADCGAAYDVAPPWMTPKPRRARRAAVSLTAGPAAVLENWTPAPLAAPPRETLNVSRETVAAPLASVPNVSRETSSIFDRPSVMTPKPKTRARRESPEQACRAEYDRYIMALFERAQLECNSFFDTAARVAGAPRYTAWELFTHRKTVIAKWGSEELLSFFSFNRRLSYAQFREQFRAGQQGERSDLERVS